MQKTWIVILALALGAAPLVARGPAGADDDRAATADEEQRIRSALEQKGYKNVHDIEVDDGRFEVDAVSPAGDNVDLELDLRTLEIVHEKQD